ncbi:hypothetical protein FRC08_002454 [Ceratobasidium sp. 394]|nr:hypothetical protein FRC08_002454 [Ceratobasidium sp. 394]
MTILSDFARTEPFKTLFILHKLAVILVKLPIWVAFYVRHSNRPRASWSLTKAVLIKALRNMPELAMRSGRFNGRDVTKEVALKDCRGTRFIWLEAVPLNLIIGQLKQFAQVAGVESVRIPAYGFGQWESGSTNVRLAGDSEKIVMHLHGGAYVMGTAHPEDLTANISRGLLEQGKGAIFRTLSVDYRLCSSAPYPKSAPFPSAIIDALAGYVYLVQKLGFKPQNVIVAGDSAGGNLALALIRYLRDNPKLGLGMPGGLLLFSPWCDPAGTHHGPTAQKASANVRVDYISPRTDSPYSMGAYAVRSLLGSMSHDMAAKNPYIGPASLEIEPSVVDGMFNGFPPTYILSGEGELLIDEIRTLQRRMLADLPEGNLVYDEVADAVHDFTVFQFWEPERSSAFQRMVAWIRGL